jgi:hypothetical protein
MALADMMSRQGYNGNVEYQGQIVPVRNGQAEFGGEKFIVSDDGRIVVNERSELVGIISGGKFQQATPEIVEQLKQEGAFDEQPQGMAEQAPQQVL